MPARPKTASTTSSPVAPSGMPKAAPGLTCLESSSTGTVPSFTRRDGLDRGSLKRPLAALI